MKLPNHFPPMVYALPSSVDLDYRLQDNGKDRLFIRDQYGRELWNMETERDHLPVHFWVMALYLQAEGYVAKFGNSVCSAEFRK